MATDLESSLGILSAAPWFDDATALDLLSLTTDAWRHAAGDTPSLLSRLERAGLFVRRGNVRRVAEPLRTRLRRSLHGEDEALYLRAVGVFADHAVNELAPYLSDVMGDEGSALNIAAIRTLVRPEDTPAFNELIDLIQEPSGTDESHKAMSAARVYEMYGFKSDRKSDFLRGLALWTSGRHFEAEICFKTVLISKTADKARAIAAHLTAVSKHREGDLQEALKLLVQSIDDLRLLADEVGLAVVLTTFGRVQRDAYRETQNENSISESISALEEAATLNQENGRLDGRNLIALSQSYFAGGRVDEALTTGEKAVSELWYGEDAVAARCHLATIKRELGDTAEARVLLDSALEIANNAGVRDQSLARLLNMLAANERRAGDLKNAKRHAQESLTLGRRLEDQRHIAHAGHTLASILLDVAEESPNDEGSSSSVAAAFELLNESRQILIGLRSRSGIEMVEATMGRIKGSSADNEDGNIESAGS